MLSAPCLRLLRRLSRFQRDRRAVAAVEFAVILPLLLALASGAYEISRAVGASRHVNEVANSIAAILATNTSGSVTYLGLHYAFDSAMLTFPEVLLDSASKGTAWGNDISISMAGVVFKPMVIGCTSGCTYLAQVSWTGGATARKCLSLQLSTADTNQPTPTTLPADLFTPLTNSNGGNSAPPFSIAVDVSYTWQPRVFTSLIKPIVFKRSAFITPRYASQIAYNKIAGDDGFGAVCAVL